MKTLRLMSMLFIAAALSFGFASCGDDDDEKDDPTPVVVDPTPVDVNYANVIPGHWANSGLADEVMETIGINYRGAGTIALEYSEDEGWSVMAFGSYSLSGEKIVASYTDVSVYDGNYKSGTYNGFTNGKSKTVTYTIQSCDGKKLVLKDESGKTQTYEKYADVK